MFAMRGSRPWWTGLGLKVFASFLVVIAVGVVTLWGAISYAAPTFFELHVAEMLGGAGMGSMMAGPEPAARGSALDATLAEIFRSSLTQALLVATGTSLATALAASVLVTSRVVGPLRRLATASQRLAAGHYAERVPGGSADELGDLALSFNEMAGALEQTERRRRELIGDVAHELRTPIATLEGYLEGVLDGVIEPNERTWARLHDEAGRLRRLVDDLQELSRAEARQIPLSLRPVDPARIVRTAVDRLDGQFAEKGLVLRVEVPPRLPAVRADGDRAVQVLTNLLVNALHYTPAPGTVRLGVKPAGDAVQFIVSDTGLGIAPEHLPHLFERFYRVDRSRSRALGGSGIGLTISQALVEAMGGRIWADSPGPGQGATFTFTLPTAA